jgi:hypothetical protein
VAEKMIENSEQTNMPKDSNKFSAFERRRLLSEALKKPQGDYFETPKETHANHDVLMSIDDEGRIIRSFCSELESNVEEKSIEDGEQTSTPEDLSELSVSERRRVLMEALRTPNTFISVSGVSGEVKVEKNENEIKSEVDILYHLWNEAGAFNAFINAFASTLCRIGDNSSEYLKILNDIHILVPARAADGYWQEFHSLIDKKFAFALEKMNESERVDIFRQLSILLKKAHGLISESANDILNFLLSSDDHG